MLPMKTTRALGRLFVAALCGVAFLPAVVWAEPAEITAMENLLQQERRQFEALGSNKAKKIAGIGSSAKIRVASLSKPKDKVKESISSFRELNALPNASGGAQWACLTEALYFEARGETFDSMAAVAEVILNRRNSSRFPSTICAVVSQGVGGRPGCQFSYKCDGRKEVYNEPKAYIRVGKMARLMLDGVLPKLTNGALFYHNATVRPRWSRKFRRTATVGGHMFYKP
jgi:spore germination cell wall hydrolase CwlJ-like protein